MASWTNFQSKPILLDVTVPAIGAGQTLTSPTTGSITVGTGTIQVTPNSILSTAIAAGYVADVTEIAIISPIIAQGNYPDAVVTLVNGTTNLQNVLWLDASYGGNMFPRWKVTRGRQRIVLGYSTRDVLRKHARRVASGAGGVKNLPLKITGLKVTSSLTVQVYSVAGWANPLVPLRIICRGDLLASEDLAELNNYPYDGTIQLSVPPTPTFSTHHSLPGPLSLNWGALPGGNHQGPVRVFRRLTFAYNFQQIPASGPYVFSQLNALQGAVTNVAQTYNDLGDYFKDNQNAFLWQEFGLNLYAPNTQLYVDMQVDGTKVPQDTPFGTLITTGNNDFAYGAVALNGQGAANSTEFDRIPPVDLLGQFLAYQNGVVPVVASANGQPIAANQVSIAKGGVLITQGQ
jgi:hypothetical protein